MIDSWSGLHSFLVPFSKNKGFQNYLTNCKRGDAIADSSRPDLRQSWIFS